jgi:hypothetical protein
MVQIAEGHGLAEVLTAVGVVRVNMNAQHELPQMAAWINVGEDQEQLIRMVCKVQGRMTQKCKFNDVSSASRAEKL